MDYGLGDRGHAAPPFGALRRPRQSKRRDRAVPEVWRVREREDDDGFLDDTDATEVLRVRMPVGADGHTRTFPEA